jgi:glyoxylase-like metal-dependent hydrolase (beta-lactamase superfamily II)
LASVSVPVATFSSTRPTPRLPVRCQTSATKRGAGATTTFARAAIDAHGNRPSRVTSAEVFRGVTALPLPGHMPRHTGFLVTSGKHSPLIWGDILHVQGLQGPSPEVGLMVDADRDLATATRRRVFDQVATDRLAVAGMHLHVQPFAHLARERDGYRPVPDAWSMDLDGDTQD